MGKMKDITRNGTRLEALHALAERIAEQIDEPGDTHSMAQLARQYRETMSEIAELEAESDEGDVISRLIGDVDAR